MALESLAKPLVDLTTGLVEGVLGPGQTLLGFGQGYNIFTPVITFAPFLVGLIVLQFLIAFWYPTYKNTYDQATPSQFARNLERFREILYQGISLAAALFVWIPLIYEAIRQLKRDDMTSVYYSALDIILVLLLLGFMYFLFAAFTKFDYGGLNLSFGFWHCETDDKSSNTTDASRATCKRTRWQSIRDAFLSGGYYYFGSMLYPLLNASYLLYMILASSFLAALR